jgi:hypothetical protein
MPRAQQAIEQVKTLVPTLHHKQYLKYHVCGTHQNEEGVLDALVVSEPMSALRPHCACRKKWSLVTGKCAVLAGLGL